MDMLNEMMVFAQVVKSGGFSAAARELKVEASSVSRSVTRLEKHLGTRLLYRTTRGISLTDVGERVFKECGHIAERVQSIRSLTHLYREEPRGILKVSAPVAFGQLWLAPRLAGFLRACPDVDLRITLVDRPVDLVDDGADLAIRISDEWPQGLVVRKILPVRYVLIASPMYLAQRGHPQSPAELTRHDCLCLGYGAFGMEWQMRRAGVKETVRVGARMTLNNSLAVAAAAQAGAGIGLVPDFSARQGIEEGSLICVLPEWRFAAPYDRDVAVVHLPGAQMPSHSKAFIDYLLSTIEPSNFGA